jgi:hypothetical protein
MIKFQIDPIVAMEMYQLPSTTQWDVLVPKPHTFYNSLVLIYSFNIRSLHLRKNDVFSYYNFKTTHILCLNETNFNTLTSNNTSLNIDTRLHSTISVNGQNCTMIIYDNFITLSSHETFTSLRVEYIVTTLNANTRKVNYIIKIYKPSTLFLLMFKIHLQKFFDLMLISCPTIIIDNFNINMPMNKTQHNQMNSKILWTNIQSNFSFKKLQQFINLILLMYGQMHALNNAY